MAEKYLLIAEKLGSGLVTLIRVRLFPSSI